mmetsp:Transcript_116497/g.276920  ORF Transcript_116497/g.276920 Transcript_116497/m.276920 type:complete len:109 (-) Transcript_116497:1115-1441(-)
MELVLPCTLSRGIVLRNVPDLYRVTQAKSVRGEFLCKVSMMDFFAGSQPFRTHMDGEAKRLGLSHFPMSWLSGKDTVWRRFMDLAGSSTSQKVLRITSMDLCGARTRP